MLLFVGAMWRPVNSDACIYFLDSIWPLIRQKIPEAGFQIVGGKPPAALAERSGRENVVVTGYVEDLMPYYRNCSVVVVPLLAAGGVIAKIADAMRIGIPVVATSVANQGTKAIVGRDICIGDEPAEFASHVVSLLQDEALYSRISFNAEQFILDNFDWKHSVQEIEDLYKIVVLKKENRKNSNYFQQKKIA